MVNEFVKTIKFMLNDARNQSKSVYCYPLISDCAPMHIVAVRTFRGMALAKTNNGNEFPVSKLNITRFYIA